ncbi:SAM-dependent methyltransferase [Streptomyces sp. NPDC057249]|uniref:SAM-dependent methyltransferase n=1 Tax=Streptomyces sp. NPDC057249 TaxID=3346067 RepID=UPI00362F89B3
MSTDTEYQHNQRCYGTAWAPATRVPRPPEDWAHHAASARMYDRLLGGSDNYASDRAVLADLSEDDFERLRTAARINLEHNSAVVTRLADEGFTQFLDLGCGYPSPWQPARDVDETALTLIPVPRVVYVDIDPHAVAHRRMRCENEKVVRIVQGDLARMDTLLRSAQVSGALDLTRPVAVLAHDVLPWLSDADAAKSMRILREWAPPGSALSITHACDLGPTRPSMLTPPARDKAALTYLTRDKEVIREYAGGWPMLEPGLVPTARWDRESPLPEEMWHASGAYAGVAIKPAASAAEARGA